MRSKSKTEITKRVGLLNAPLSAAQRTQAMFKHRCIHCGGLDPCLPETLIAVGVDDAPVGAQSTGATSVPTSCQDGIPNGVRVSEEGDEWRNAYAHETGEETP